MKCSNCGAELPEDSQFCNKCGAKVEINNTISESNQIEEDSLPGTLEDFSSDLEENGDKKFIRKDIKQFIVISLVLLLIVFLGTYFLNPIIKYNNAVKSMNSKDYNQAITAFEELGKYKDSSEQIKKCKYQQAKELLDSKKYSESIQAFTKLGDYADSKNMILEAKYQLSKSYLSKCDYKNAVKSLSGVSNYKDSDSLLQEEKYKLANYYYEEKEYSNSEQMYEELADYKDSKNKIIEVEYDDAVSKYKDGTFTDAQRRFEKIKAYKDSNEYLKKLNFLIKFQGTWEENETKFQKIFSGWKVSEVCYPNSNKTQVYDFNYTLDNNKLIIVSDDIIMLNGDKLIEKDYLNTCTYTKIGSNESIPESSPEPSIGMTAEEVRNSLWGSPETINKTTTASTVHEQWVYSGNRYIYLDNGIVTAIQD